MYRLDQLCRCWYYFILLVCEWEQNCFLICRSGRLCVIANNFANPCWQSSYYVLSVGKGNKFWIIGNTTFIQSGKNVLTFWRTKSSRVLILQRQVTGVLHLFVLAICDHHDPSVIRSEQREKYFFELLQISNFFVYSFSILQKTIGNYHYHW